LDTFCNQISFVFNLNYLIAIASSCDYIWLQHLHILSQLFDSKDEKDKDILTLVQLQIYFTSTHVNHIWVDPSTLVVDI
jgi:hypothetical protein